MLIKKLSFIQNDNEGWGILIYTLLKKREEKKKEKRQHTVSLYNKALDYTYS